MKIKTSQEHSDVLNAMIANQGKNELLHLLYGSLALVLLWYFGNISALLAMSLGALLYLVLGAWYFLNALKYEWMVRDYKLQNSILAEEVEWEESYMQRAAYLFILPIVLMALVALTPELFRRSIQLIRSKFSGNSRSSGRQ